MRVMRKKQIEWAKRGHGEKGRDENRESGREGKRLKKKANERKGKEEIDIGRKGKEIKRKGRD